MRQSYRNRPRGRMPGFVENRWSFAHGKHQQRPHTVYDLFFLSAALIYLFLQ